MEDRPTARLTDDLVLRDVVHDDLPHFFEHQRDPVAARVAAFAVKDPSDRDAFLARWDRILRDDTISIQTIVADGHVAGSVSSYADGSHREVTYWLGRSFWGKDIATAALRAFLEYETTRPLHARVAKDNVGSLRVLQKCGFVIVGEDRGFANARGEEIEEYLLELSQREDDDGPES